MLMAAKVSSEAGVQSMASKVSSEAGVTVDGFKSVLRIRRYSQWLQMCSQKLALQSMASKCDQKQVLELEHLWSTGVGHGVSLLTGIGTHQVRRSHSFDMHAKKTQKRSELIMSCIRKTTNKQAKMLVSNVLWSMNMS